MQHNNYGAGDELFLLKPVKINSETKLNITLSNSLIDSANNYQRNVFPLIKYQFYSTGLFAIMNTDGYIYFTANNKIKKSVMSRYASSELFKHLRVYKRLTLPLIINDMLCNRIMKLSFFVDKAQVIYKYSCKVFGKNFVNWCINSTYCKVFTAGNTINEADQTSEYFRSQGNVLYM